ncbi:hypothetical protein M404DRAFT_966125 [Pisolithus tinctorius Marx 270]|uniref:2-(3-amino-3-carboxypropyl)histidine synthase subunit 2 n=1 Tax=Pisolithus tinctorius Marx 270 TaxID=870435 RepID=A0A0C3NUU5_PISTI|nr:hypothetical protein M404DRAFT_966125 [Pisolithus tinctorius Marx 270]
MATTFSASGEEAIKHSIDLESRPSAQRPRCSDILEFFEIEQTAKEIRDGDYKRVALQFPDELLHESVPIYRLLKQRVNEGQEMYVLADTSYGSCCVDEVAAQHVDADFIVHYGHACLSQTSRLPVIYVFGRKPIDVHSCVKQIVDVITSNAKDVSSVLIRHDVAYSYRAGEVVKELRNKIAATTTRIVYHTVPTKMEPSSLSLQSQLDPSPIIIIYIGDEGLTLTNILMTHSSNEVYSYNPATNVARLESGRTNKLLMRRFAVVQKARDACLFLFFVGLVCLGSSLCFLSFVLFFLFLGRRASYLVWVGWLHLGLLASLMSIVFFLLVVCPSVLFVVCCMLVVARWLRWVFFLSIVRPPSLALGLSAACGWLGGSVFAFFRLLADGECVSGQVGGFGLEVFCCLLGSWLGRARFCCRRGCFGVVFRNSGALVGGILGLIIHNVARIALFLQSRTYRGLDARVGEDTPSVLEQGRSGTARGYTNELPPPNV